MSTPAAQPRRSAVPRVWIREPIERSIVVANDDGFRLGVLAQRLDAILTPKPGVLRATPRGGRIVSVVVVEPDNTDVEVVSDAMRALDVLRPYCRGKAEGAVVCQLNRLGLVLELVRDDDWAEDFFLQYIAV